MGDRLIRIQEGTWFYFSVDLDFKGFAAFTFERFVEANDRRAALVTFTQQKYFSSKVLLLLPSTTDNDYFKARENEILSVWTFDGTQQKDAMTVDLRTEWPKNIWDKAAVTPSRETALQWTTRSNTPLQGGPAKQGRPLS
jgi:hypothetical protein